MSLQKRDVYATIWKDEFTVDDNIFKDKIMFQVLPYGIGESLRKILDFLELYLEIDLAPLRISFGQWDLFKITIKSSMESTVFVCKLTELNFWENN